jgi:hypothetical protein
MHLGRPNQFPHRRDSANRSPLGDVARVEYFDSEGESLGVEYRSLLDMADGVARATPPFQLLHSPGLAIKALATRRRPNSRPSLDTKSSRATATAKRARRRIKNSAGAVGPSPSCTPT